MKRLIALAAISLVGLSMTADAQTSHSQGHAGRGAAPSGGSESTKAFRAANARMHKDMDIRFAGDPDVDFVRAMIPHHRGAIEMAKVQLKYGKDEQIRKLATDVIREQEREIADMEVWLKKRGK
ncbi:MAG: DUF305 domain-containing protein [Hyphomicrobiaceae bacterium]